MLRERIHSLLDIRFDVSKCSFLWATPKYRKLLFTSRDSLILGQMSGREGVQIVELGTRKALVFFVRTSLQKDDQDGR